MKIRAILTSHVRKRPVVAGVVTVLAFGLLAGSLTRLFRLRAELHRTRQEVVRLQDLVRHLQEDLWKVAPEDLDDRFGNFAERLPENASGVRAWFSEVQCLASNLRLLVSPTWGDAEVVSGPWGRFERIQVTLEVKPEKDAGKNKTGAVVRWLRELNLDQPPLELNRVHLSGTQQGLALAVVAGNLWVRVSEPTAP
ncbi:MAG: hypothetical protein J0M24_04890 [Verrucomicrobia bacterium]|nr:hypothetical protein [Verrucomicrobiota bacterium]